VTEEDRPIGRLSRVYKEELDAKVESFFEGLPGPLDWSEKLARQILVYSLEYKDAFKSFGSEEDYSPEKLLLYSITVPLAHELCGFRGDARDDIDKRVKNKVDHITKKMRDEFGGASYLAEHIRERASQLDEKGLSAEANALRDAANILNEEF